MRGSLRTGLVTSFAVIVALCILSLGAALAEDDPVVATVVEAIRWIDLERFDKAIEILKPLAASEEVKTRPEYAMVLELLGQAHYYGQEQALAEKEFKDSLPLLEESAKTDTGKAYLYLTGMSVVYHSLGIMASKGSRWKECADYHTREMLLPYTTMGCVPQGSTANSKDGPLRLCPP